MKRSPGLVTPGSSRPVGYTWPLQMGTAAEIPDPEVPLEPWQVCMTSSATFPLCVVPIDGNRDFLTQQTPAAQGPRAGAAETS